ncbi:glycoside hydrolase family 13 protein [Aerococcus sp. 1KP-2016]|uniref:glycoside hydrolase family 13 protein n=1 Tax=Aerococcus sp. 1KP-2016 TaxID=1981982 RepID=UPI000B998AFF|nr:glycoside hydrolase family 13 protein [Aerococcus sp. 1KP-2016]OYQ65626.1 alpha-glycosidase [Aerococcus sp. 1KP-2016]
MDKAALYHRPESEFAYLYSDEIAHIRLQTKKDDVKAVDVLAGDVYLHHEGKWYQSGIPMTKVGATETHDFWQASVTIPTRRLAYGFKVYGHDGEDVFYCDRGVYHGDDLVMLEQVNAYFRLPYFHERDMMKTPEWVKHTVWYQIFPERFANGNPANDPEGVLAWDHEDHPGHDAFYGGDLQGIIDHLDYLQDLGITGLYLTPIFKAHTNHKYDTTDYMTIDPAFGNATILKNLVDQAHERGMKVMLDAVFNHIGYYAPQWQDVLANQEDSIYRDWFHIRKFPVQPFEPVNYTDPDALTAARQGLTYHAFAFEPHMPKFNTANPEVHDYLLKVATHYIEAFDIDGWRLDVANEVDHQFWKDFFRACTGLKEDFYIIGEIWHSSQKFLEGDEFHAVMNYAMTDQIKDFFFGNPIDERPLSSGRMRASMTRQRMLYRDQVNQVQFNLLDSHDTDRVLHRAKGDKQKVKAALTFMMMLEGTPCIYYGTEVGLDGGHDPDCRRVMIWDEAAQDKDMLAFTKDLIQLRKQYSDLITYGEFHWRLDDLADVANHRVLSFEKIDQDWRMLAIFNQGSEIIAEQFDESINIVSSNLANFEENRLTVAPGGWAICIDRRA